VGIALVDRSMGHPPSIEKPAEEKPAERRPAFVRVLRAAGEWPGQHGLATLVALCVLAAAVWGFAEVADEVLEGESQRFDERAILMLRDTGPDGRPVRDNPWGPPWVEEMARDVTAFGGVACLGLLTVLSGAYLWLHDRGRTAVWLIATVVVGVAVSTGLKRLFARPRPAIVDHGSIVHTASFPSGHSMLAAVAYLTIAAILIRARPGRRHRTFVLVSAVLVVVAVGVSRVYLGVHYPTDVAAGWSAGAAWAAVCWLITRQLQRRRAVEPEPPDTADAEPGV